jgi:hypothetical protein
MLMFAWVAEMVLVTYRDFKSSRTVLGLPPPSDYLATFLVFGTLAGISQAKAEGAEEFASLFAWSLVVASLLNVFDPSNPLSGGGLTSAPPLTGTPSSSTPAVIPDLTRSQAPNFTGPIPS